MSSKELTTECVLRARLGDRAAFDELARAHLRPAYAIALGIVGRPADAEDVAQEALLLAFERLDSCREPARFPAWLFQIVRNQARNWLDRRRLRDVPATDDVPEVVESGPRPDGTAHRARLLQALGVLGAVQREVVLLHDLEEWTHREIATAIGISELMSRQHLFQARQKLRAELEDRSVTEVHHER